MVHLSTESGKWHYDAELGDRFFGEYLASLAEVGPLPESIVFRSTVAEVIEKEWFIGAGLTMWIESMEKSYDTRMNADLLMHIPAAARLVPLYGTWSEDNWGSALYNVHLSDVARISNIITLPKDWRMYVMLGDDVSEKEAVRHILATGREVIEAYEGLPSYDRHGLVKYEKGSVVPMIEACIEAEDDPDAKLTTAGILWALARDAAMTKLNKDRYATAITPLDFRWDIALAAMDEAGVPRTSGASATAATMAGRIDPDAVVYTAIPDFSLVLEEFGEAQIEEGEQLGLVSRMYAHFLPMLTPESLEGSFAFIEERVEGNVEHPNLMEDAFSPVNPLLKIPGWVHNTLASQLKQYDMNMINPREHTPVAEVMLEADNYKPFIRLLDRFVAGREVLVRIASIKPTMHDSGRWRWKAFTSVVREYIDETEEPELSLFLPTPIDIARAKED